MADLGGLELGYLPHGAFDVSGDEYVRCGCCGYGGCDVRVSSCGCTLHARCIQLTQSGPLQVCPLCHKPTDELMLLAMSFREIDDAQHASVPNKKSRKRKADNSSETTANDPRTGRWTNEETMLCDKLMHHFNLGELPVADSVKLNEFLGGMLKSKQSRLTKKMKNAKLSTKLFRRSTGCLSRISAREFSEVEERFFASILDLQQRAEIKFHMQREWREQFSRVCAALQQPLDTESWLLSVEEMDRRSSKARDAARMAKRKVMMGVALEEDSRNLEAGIFIEKSLADQQGIGADDFEKELLDDLVDTKTTPTEHENSSVLHSAPFLVKVTSYMQRHKVPFEHVDLWVPSYVDNEDDTGTICRLCYAGNSTSDKIVVDHDAVRALTPDERFNFLSFGDYSQKFSFNVGCGLPGRVYEDSRSSWVRNLHTVPRSQFERCGGANQWSIKTALGLPIASPNVGRIVVVLYSCHDRVVDGDLVTRLSDEFTRLMPSPRWKLVVDIGEAPEELAANSTDRSAAVPTSSSQASVTAAVNSQASVAATANSVSTAATMAAAAATTETSLDPRCQEVVSILTRHMPSDPSSPLNSIVSGFMSLRLLLVRPASNPVQESLITTMLDSYSAYASNGRTEADIAVMLSRDFLFLSQQSAGSQAQQQPSFQSQLQALVPVQADVAADPSNELQHFSLPSTRLSLEESPALFPIPDPDRIDSLPMIN